MSNVRKEDFTFMDVRKLPLGDKEAGMCQAEIRKNYWWFTLNGKVLLYNRHAFQCNQNKTIMERPFMAHLYELFPDLKLEQIEMAYIPYKTSYSQDGEHRHYESRSTPD